MDVPETIKNRKCLNMSNEKRIFTDEKFILTMNPCGSGGRLLKMGVYQEPLNFSRLKKAGPHTWGKENLPIYCSHCVWAHEILPLHEGGPG
jgi:hypothetical protein